MFCNVHVRIATRLVFVKQDVHDLDSENAI